MEIAETMRFFGTELADSSRSRQNNRLVRRVRSALLVKITTFGLTASTDASRVKIPARVGPRFRAESYCVRSRTPHEPRFSASLDARAAQFHRSHRQRSAS